MSYKDNARVNVIGNVEYADGNIGFKDEVKGVFESYTSAGVDLIHELPSIISSRKTKADFIDALCESMQDSPLGHNDVAMRSPFYNNYTDRVEQLLENTLDTIATESVMTGYAPIVAYNPFFLKKQWIDCIWKDVLMTEIPKTPVIEMAMERRYLKDLSGNEYPLPECLYDATLVQSLMNSATGLNIKEDPIAINLCKNLNLIDPTYIPGVVFGDKTVELTQGLTIFKVVMTDTQSQTHDVPVNIGLDISTHNFVKGKIRYDVYDDDDEFVETLEDELIGNVNFKDGKITVMSTTGKVTKICLRGKTANRFNQRSLDVVRRVEKIEWVMPESGPRLNSAITIEDAADALALQNIDIIADNINMMGSTLANFEDAEDQNFILQSFAAEKAGAAAGIPYNELGVDSFIVEGGYQTLPYEGYSHDIPGWLKGSREYFERMIGALKTKLRSSNMVIVAVAHPNLIRFLQDGINWVFSEDTQISGVKLSYNFGVYTSAQDRVHIITTMRLSEDDGIRFIVIPLTQELITFKAYKYNVTIDRNYRHPLYSLVPNIMATMRHMVKTVFPVQGLMTIQGREMFSPDTLER